MDIFFESNWSRVEGGEVRGLKSGATQQEVERLVLDVVQRLPYSALAEMLRMGWKVTVEKGIHLCSPFNRACIQVKAMSRRFHIYLEDASRGESRAVWRVCSVQ